MCSILQNLYENKTLGLKVVRVSGTILRSWETIEQSNAIMQWQPVQFNFYTKGHVQSSGKRQKGLTSIWHPESSQWLKTHFVLCFPVSFPPMY